MSPKGGVFFDEWQACLRSHYLYVLRTQDWVTERTLSRVLLNSGLTDNDLARLQQQADVDPVRPDEADVDGAAALPAYVDDLPDELTVADDEMVRVDEEPTFDELAEAEDDASDAPPDAPPSNQLSLF